MLPTIRSQFNDMFYCLIASYYYVIEHCYALSNLKRTAVTLYVISFADKLITIRMLHRKVRPRWHMETVKFLESYRFVIVNTYFTYIIILLSSLLRQWTCVTLFVYIYN